MLFGKKKAEDAGKLYAPAKGTVIGIEEAPDKVFSEKILGDGVAVIIEEGRILAPAAGKVINVADTLHAYGIETADGLELLIHVGINTVALNGEGFTCKVREGQKVKRGDVLCEVDTAYLLENGCSLHTPVLITNMDSVTAITAKNGDAIGGESVIVEYEKWA